MPGSFVDQGCPRAPGFRSGGALPRGAQVLDALGAIDQGTTRAEEVVAGCPELGDGGLAAGLDVGDRGTGVGDLERQRVLGVARRVAEGGELRAQLAATRRDCRRLGHYGVPTRADACRQDCRRGCRWAPTCRRSRSALADIAADIRRSVTWITTNPFPRSDRQAWPESKRSTIAVTRCSSSDITPPVSRIWSRRSPSSRRSSRS